MWKAFFCTIGIIFKFSFNHKLKTFSLIETYDTYYDTISIVLAFLRGSASKEGPRHSSYHRQRQHPATIFFMGHIWRLLMGIDECMAPSPPFHTLQTAIWVKRFPEHVITQLVLLSWCF